MWDGMRLFFAVEAGGAISDRVWGIIQDSPIRRAPWRWIKPENYHFTLKFLGEVDDRLVPPLGDAARRAASRSSPFTLSLEGIGAFPDLGRPRVIFYGIGEGFEELRKLAGLVEDECEILGFERERKRFRAHLTLARVRRPVPEEVTAILRAFPGAGEEARLEVGRFVLMSSRLTPSGAIYTEEASFDLGAGGTGAR
jgi:2'-5' RNA ligase